MRAVWTCPACGRQFVQRTIEHTCAVFSLDSLLSGKPAIIGELLKAYLAEVRKLGEVSIEPLKTSIMLRSRTNFGGIKLQQGGLRCTLMLGSVPDSPRIQGHAPYGGQRESCSFILSRAEDIDEELRAWLVEAFSLA